MASLDEAISRVPEVRVPREPRRRWLRPARIAALGGLAVILAVVWFVLGWHRPAPEDLAWERDKSERSLTIHDRKTGRTVFEREFPSPIIEPLIARFRPQSDLALFVGTSGGTRPGQLYLFDLHSSAPQRLLGRRSDKLLWEKDINAWHVFPRDMEPAPVFNASREAVFDFEGDGLPDLLVIANHVTHSPSILAVLGSNGDLKAAYPNIGQMDLMLIEDLDQDGGADVLVHMRSHNPEGVCLASLDNEHWSNKLEAEAETARWTLFIPHVAELKRYWGDPFLYTGFASSSHDPSGRRLLRLCLGPGLERVCPYQIVVTPNLEVVSTIATDAFRAEMAKAVAEARVSRDYSAPQFLQEWARSFVRVQAGGPLISGR